METHIGISNTHRQEVANELSKLLADEFMLYTITRNAHWNMEGLDFFDKHTFFEIQFKQLDTFIDTIAERIRSLGHYAPATLDAFLNLTQISEMSRDKNDSHRFIKELLADHEQVILNLRLNIPKFTGELEDAGTADFITNIMAAHEKMAWMLRSHLEEKTPTPVTM
jgi:starvation-inducible DNA-binding protein